MRKIKIRHWISILLLPLAAFYSCNVEEISRGGDTPLPEGITRLTATVGTGLKTRAVGDPLNDATDDEKRIDRVAFFVHTEAEGMQVYEPAKAGETHADFPNKVQLEATTPGDPSGGYTATVDLTTGAGYDADIIAVANLPEDYDYSQIVSWQGLLDSVAVGTFTPSMPLCTGDDGAGHDNAFVMCGSTTVALHKEKEETFNLALERLTARIDITNEAYVQGMTDDDPKGGFLLTGVRILHARPQSYIMPQMDYVSPDVATVSDWKATPDQIRLVKVAGDIATDVTDGTPDEQATATCQRIWHSLYTYENHETEHAPTGLEITGKFRGLAVTRQIPFEVTEADGTTKRAVPVVRNHRYLVRILPAPGQTDLTYSVQVGEWNAVDTINVQPNQDQLPVVTNVACAEATKTFGGDLAGGIMPDTLVVPADGGTLTFTASCPFDTRVTAEYFSPEDGNSWLEVTDRSEATVTKGDISLAREYTITIKASPALKNGLDKDPTYTNAYVNRAYLYIANGGNGSMVDTVVVYQGTDIAYGNTRFAAVTLGEANGKPIVWAPVNIGATELTTGLVMVPGVSDPNYDESVVQNELQCGSYFQWGRKTPFSYSASRTAKVTSTQFSSVEEAESSTLRYYTGSEVWLSGGLIPNLWNAKGKITGASESVTDVEKTAHDPCPTGWRIPTKTEFEALLAIGMTIDNDNSKYYTSIKKANAELRIPKGGGIAAMPALMNHESFCMSSTLSSTIEYMWISNNVSTYIFTSFCAPIRCVKE